MPTTNWNLPLFGPTDTAALDVLLNGQSNAIDTALTSAVTSFIGTDAQRQALTAPKRREGATFRTTDTDMDWFYDGSNWVTREPGLFLIRPTSLVNATVSADGTITPTSVSSSFSINGIFSARFSSYRITYRLDSPSPGSYSWRFRRSGADLSGAGYTVTRIYASGTGNALANVSYSNTSSPVDAGAVSAQHFGYITLHEPGRTQPMKSWEGLDAQVGQGTHYSGMNGSSEVLNPIDGITFLGNGNTFQASGGLKVYGYA